MLPLLALGVFQVFALYKTIEWINQEVQSTFEQRKEELKGDFTRPIISEAKDYAGTWGWFLILVLVVPQLVLLGITILKTIRIIRR